jgi:hypothetical protein
MVDSVNRFVLPVDFGSLISQADRLSAVLVRQ